MKVIGIIAEYNPFHNGHAYQIEQARKQYGADYVIAVMSGDFVQRGAPAIVDKYTRAEMALRGGADAVLELPNIWAVASAEFFANGAITALDKLGIVDGVCFGCETPNLEELQEVAGYLAKEPVEFQQTLQKELQAGKTYPQARLLALQSCLEPNKWKNVEELLASPNNILGIEYLKAIRRRNSGLKAFPIQRVGQSYHGTEQETEQDQMGFPSASAIRGMILNHRAEQIRNGIPETSLPVFLEKINQNLFLQENDFSAAIAYSLLHDTEYEKIADVTPDLANRIRNLIPEYQSCTDFCMRFKTRELTYTRVSRVLFHALFGHTKEVYEQAHALGDVPYLRLLGIRKESLSLLSEMKRKASIPILCKQKEIGEQLQTDAGVLLQSDNFASALYRTTLIQKTKCKIPEEKRRQLLII